MRARKERTKLLATPYQITYYCLSKLIKNVEEISLVQLPWFKNYKGQWSISLRIFTLNNNNMIVFKGTLRQPRLQAEFAL